MCKTSSLQFIPACTHDIHLPNRITSICRKNTRSGAPVQTSEPNHLSHVHLNQPIVSTANVSQLAVDLIIATLALERVAIIDPSYFVPVVGGRESGEPGITTALERMFRDAHLFRTK